MSRIRNADEFLLRFQEIQNRYKEFSPLLNKIHQQYASSPARKIPPSVNETLEAHSRAYIVNALLAALNWRMNVSPEDGLPNLLPEAQVKSSKWGTIRFLDYLGFENDTCIPLLIVETKRLSSPLPQLIKSTETTYSAILKKGLEGKLMKGEWKKWLADIRDYVISTHKRTGVAPRRILLTNSNWIILFLDPTDAFMEEGTRDPDRILVFSDQADVKRRYPELFLNLEHGSVLQETHGLSSGELRFHVKKDTVDRVMYGLRLHYIKQTGIYASVPVIKIAPIIFLRSKYGSWLRVEQLQKEYDLPHENNQLSSHLEKVKKAANNLLKAVNTNLGARLRPTSISIHYRDEDSFGQLPGVKNKQDDKFLIATGDKTHYILPESSVPACPYHKWVNAQTNPIMTRSTEPRSFFVSSEKHHCAHSDVNSAKSSPITPQNKEDCGPRSGQNGQAFCEIWGFESHLCCHGCVFEEVCIGTQVFRLPCQQVNRRYEFFFGIYKSIKDWVAKWFSN